MTVFLLGGVLAFLRAREAGKYVKKLNFIPQLFSSLESASEWFQEKRWKGLSSFQSVLICLGSCRRDQIQALTHPARSHADSQPASCTALMSYSSPSHQLT